MLLRSCADLIRRQVPWRRPLFIVSSLTPGYATESAIPSKPRRNKSAWVFYVTENVTQARAENPNVPNIFHLLSNKWKTLNQEAQKKYIKLSEEDKIRYSKEINAYNATVTAEVALAESRERERKRGKRELSIEKKKLKELGIPKRPPNAYILFSSDFMNKKVSELPEGSKFTVKEQATLASEAWSKLSVDEKAKWYELAAAKLKEFKEKVGEWESEMASKGYLETLDKKRT